MTASNGTICPHPLANPFNTRLGPANCTLNPLRRGFAAINTEVKSLPEPVMLCQGNEDLHAPCQETPMRDFLAAYEQQVSNAVWRDEDIFSLKTQSNGLSHKDIAYWQHAEKESQKLSASMGELQKRMLAFAEQAVPKSKLVDESLKAK